MKADSKVMKSDMLKAAEGRLRGLFPGLSGNKYRFLAKKSVDMFVAKIRRDVKSGVAYVPPE